MTSLFEDHLTVDAVVAYADGEMGMLAYQRAAAHVMRCPRCAAEVAEQTSAREFLRHADAPRIPGSLFDQLRSIPVAAPTAPPVPGLHEAGELTTHRLGRARRFRMGAGLLMAGIAVGTLATAAASEHPAPPAGPGTVSTAPYSAPASLPGLEWTSTGRPPEIVQVAHRSR